MFTARSVVVAVEYDTVSSACQSRRITQGPLQAPNWSPNCFYNNLMCVKCLAGLSNNRGIVLQYNSGLTELQGIGQNISPGEFYWRELIKFTRGQERIVKPLNCQQ